MAKEKLHTHADDFPIKRGVYSNSLQKISILAAEKTMFGR
jgi:hypothetical protein